MVMLCTRWRDQLALRLAQSCCFCCCCRCRWHDYAEDALAWAQAMQLLPALASHLCLPLALAPAGLAPLRPDSLQRRPAAPLGPGESRRTNLLMPTSNACCCLQRPVLESSLPQDGSEPSVPLAGQPCSSLSCCCRDKRSWRRAWRQPWRPWLPMPPSFWLCDHTMVSTMLYSKTDL